ncbi:transporter [Sphingomonas sp. DBB INV C78]|uniref:CorA family divalent cation transporter n=1 Tax=Sphingomonas sp. DBB INV C78 TaxID=3349434 RepID=UPI0036D36ABA
MDETPPEADPLTAFGKTILQPGLIWACGMVDGHAELMEDNAPPADCAFRWIHLNLSDQRSLSWVERSVALPPAIHQAFIAPEDGQRGMAAAGHIALVLHDFERDFDRLDTGRTGALHIVAGPGILLTGRRHPLHSADIVRRRIAGGARIEDAASALDLLLGTLADTLDSRVRDVTNDIVAAEDDLLGDGSAPQMRELVTARRLCAQLHRMIAGARTALQRAEGEPEFPVDLASPIARAVQRLSALDADVVSAQTQLRLLRDELDLQAAQRTNRNIYFLSIMTALMMPATLITGFFGMNTGGLPFHGAAGTLFAGIAAVLSSLGTYFALRLMGFVRQ